MNMNDQLTWSERLPIGREDLKDSAHQRYRKTHALALVRGEKIQCCVMGCERWLKKRHRGEEFDYCPEHAISMSTTPTYILKDKLANIIIGRDLLRQLLATGKKVESWRLGYETSEDALSWNFFVALLKLNGLREVLRLFTGLDVSDAPDLFLWGNCMNRGCLPSHELQTVRQELEADLRIPTEPDIMLRVSGKVLVLIEAKFGSPNGVLKGKKKRFGGVEDFLRRYRPKPNCPDPLNRNWIQQQPPEKVMEQLCRNVIFAHWLAAEGEQVFLVNLVRRSSNDDSEQFRQHLSGESIQFRRFAWEDLFTLAAMQNKEGAPLRKYLANKTLKLSSAFDQPEVFRRPLS